MSLDEREERYRRLLLKHLAGRPVDEILFFVNRRRFAILDGAVGDILRTPGARVLNLASGPFALELYLKGRKAHVHSIDIDPALPSLHDAMIANGLIEQSTYEESDVVCHKPSGQFDLVIINDLLYDRAIDFDTVFARYRSHVKPGGVLYFDILDRRAGPLWQAFGKDSRYRRYDMAAVRDKLVGAGFKIEAEVPSLGIKGGIDRLVRNILWRGFRVANNIIFKIRRSTIVLAITAALCSFGGVEIVVEDRHKYVARLPVATSA